MTNVAVEIERPSGLVVPEARSFTATLSDVEVRDEGTDGYTFLGHAAVFDRLSVDLGGFRERIARGAFRKVLDGNPDVRFLVNHDGLPLARTTSGTMELSEDPKGLRVFARLAPTSLAGDIRILVKRGDLSQMSFGFRVGEGNDTWAQDADGNVIRTVRGFDDLLDVSLVTYPAYQQTDASVRSFDVLGVTVYDDEGEVRTAELVALADAIHTGQTEADPEARSIIDAALSKTDAISPWMAERVVRDAETMTEQRDCPCEADCTCRSADLELETRRRRHAFLGLSL